MKSYKGSGSTPPLVLNLIPPSIQGWVCLRADVDVTQEMNPLVPARIRTQYHPPHSLVTVLTELSQPASEAYQLAWTYTGKVSAKIQTRWLIHWKHLQVRLPSKLQTGVKNCMLFTSSWQARTVCVCVCAVKLCHSLEHQLLNYHLRHVWCEQQSAVHEYALIYKVYVYNFTWLFRTNLWFVCITVLGRKLILPPWYLSSVWQLSGKASQPTL
jgi:hypothetical protein